MLTGASVELKTCNAALLEATGKSWEEVVFFSQMNIFLKNVLFCWYHYLCYRFSNAFVCNDIQ